MNKKNVPMESLLRSSPSGSRSRNKEVAAGRNIRLEIEYDGTRYNGWQVQRESKSNLSTRKTRTIQETIENTLQGILQKKAALIVSGRTDSGVHAKGQVANFKTASQIALPKLQKALNSLLPKDISVSKVEEVGPDFHSRFDAKSKLYCYTILNSPYPCALLRRYSYFYPRPLNINLMRKEAKTLLGRHDFKAFCASGSNIKDTFRTIKHIDIKRLAYSVESRADRGNKRFFNYTLNAMRYPLIVIDIEANGFLYNMVRNIVGSLLEIGKGRFAQGSLRKILAAKDRKLSGPLVPARGLCLIKAKY